LRERTLKDFQEPEGLDLIYPIAVGTRFTIKARVVREKRRLFDVHAEIRTDDTPSVLLAEADATMYRMPSSAASAQREAE
jgi:acyl-coenzyme A thioesterase PaaI-like protein